MKRLTTDDLRRLLDVGPVTLLDVRADTEFELGHIPGADNVPLGSLAARVAQVMNPDSFVAVYSSGRDRLAAEAAELLESLRMTDVHLYEDGLRGWAKAGHTVVAASRRRKHAPAELRAG